MKVLKIAAIVIGAAALIATGVGAIGGLGLAAGVSSLAGLTGLTGVAASVLTGALAGAALLDVAMLANLILPKPSQGGNQVKWKPDPYAGIPYAMGRTLVGGNIVYRRGSGGDNTYEQFGTVLALGPAQSIDTTFLNKTTVTFNGDGSAQGTYNGQVWQRSQLGACPEASALQPGAGAAPGWTAQHKLSGLAATFLTFKYDTRTTNGLTTEPAPGWIGHWIKVYDPRLDDTYPGGAGACRAYEESTYVWSENPHLHGLTWAMGRYQNGVRVAGIGAGNPVAGGTVTAVDVASFVEGANLDDARGWTIGGQVVTRPDTLWNSLKVMLQAGGAQPALIGGVITSINRAPRVSLATITRSDIVGKCTFSATQPRRARINGIIPQYRSEEHDWEMVSASEVSVAAYVALDADERTKEIAYPLVQNVNQVAQLAAYDICDAREAGPGSVPLKPWWLNYKIGDCVTFSPEDDFSIKVMITGRAIEAQSGVVTYTVRGETDSKHAFALGLTGNAPPIVSLVYTTGVAAPASTDWNLSGVALTSGGASVPAIHVTGAVGNSSADAVIFEYRLDGTAPWMAASIDAPATTDKVISSVAPGASYDVAVSYRVRGVVGDRLLLGPVVAGQLAVARAAHTILSGTQNIAYPVTSTDAEVDVAAFSATIDNGQTIAFPAGAVSGLTAGTLYVVLWQISTSSYSVVPYPAAQLSSADYVYIQNQSTLMSDGTAPEQDTPPPGYGGGGNGCPVPDARILLANASLDGPGETIRAGDLDAERHWVWSPHERTGEWAAWPVERVWRLASDIWAAPNRPNTSPSHLWAATDGWQRMDAIGRRIGLGEVVGITITQAHTYVLLNEVGDWLISHNKTSTALE